MAQAPDNGCEKNGKPPRKGRETEMMKVMREHEENADAVQTLQAQDDETQADLSERFQGTIRLLRLGELRVKKRNGGLTVAEAAEKEELEEA